MRGGPGGESCVGGPKRDGAGEPGQSSPVSPLVPPSRWEGGPSTAPRAPCRCTPSPTGGSSSCSRFSWVGSCILS